MSFIKYLAAILFVSVPCLEASDALRDADGKPLPEKSFYATYEVRYDQEWPVDAHGKKSKPRELVVFNSFLEMLTDHPRALMHSNPDRYVQVLGRYLTPAQLHLAMVGGDLGQRLKDQLGEDFCVKFLSSLHPNMLLEADKGTEVLLSFGGTVLEKAGQYMATTLYDVENLQALIRGDLQNYKMWYKYLGVLPWIGRPDPKAHLDLPLHEIQEQIHRMTMNEFLMTVRFYEREFDLKNPQKETEIISTYFHPKIRTPNEFDRLQGQVVLMFEAAYNPFAPHYTLDQVHNIFHMIFRDYLQDDRPGDEICNELIQGKYEIFLNTFKENIDSEFINCERLVSPSVDGMPVLEATPNDWARSNMHGLKALLFQGVHDTLQHMWQSYLIIRQDANNVQGYHKLQGTLDAASLIIPRLNLLIKAYEDALQGVLEI